MPTKPKSAYECIECGAQYVRWQGQCDQCSEWNSLEPITIIEKSSLGDSLPAKVSRLHGQTYPGVKEHHRVCRDD